MSRSLVFFAATLAACAQAQNLSPGGLQTGSLDLAAPTGDLAGLDLAGAPPAGSDLAGGGVLHVPDFGGHDLTGMSSDLAGSCDPVKQSGCGPGLKCTVQTDPVCVTSGSVATGKICGASGSDDCVAGDDCIALDANELMCRQFCAADGDCKQAAPAGTPSGNTPRCVGVQGFGWSFCSVPCDPLKATTSCPSPMICVVGQTSTGQNTDCIDPAGTMSGMDGADCTNASATNPICAAGFTCVTESMSGSTTKQYKCRQFCAALADCSGLAGGYTCAKNAPSDTYGVCGPY